MASLQSNNHFFSLDKTNRSNNVTLLHSDNGHQHVVIIDDQKAGRAIIEIPVVMVTIVQDRDVMYTALEASKKA